MPLDIGNDYFDKKSIFVDLRNMRTAHTCLLRPCNVTNLKGMVPGYHKEFAAKKRKKFSISQELNYFILEK